MTLSPPRRPLTAVLLIALCGLLPVTGRAMVTGTTGGNQPHTNMQPSLGLNYIIQVQDGFGGLGLGEVKLFAGNFAPRGWSLADGQLLAISSNTALFSILGTTYGGDARTTFGLPDLRGRAAVHPGAGPGLSNWRLGQKRGAEQATLNANQIPMHDHSAPLPYVTGHAGGGQPHPNIQPSLGLNHLVALDGLFPSRNGPAAPVAGGFAGEPFLGGVAMFAGDFAPSGWATADGQLLPIASNQALYSILGTAFGGDGRTQFALPDLRGRVSIQPGSGPGLPNWSLGEKTGVEEVVLTQSQLPSHQHSMGTIGNTGHTGGSQAHTNMQPSLGLNYIIALEGTYPSRNSVEPALVGSEPLLGEIGLFAGNFAPRGWAFAQGQLLPVDSFQALFSILGTTYGGDGRNTFALPDLRSRTALHPGRGPGLRTRRLGEQVGIDEVILTVNQMPGHNHSFMPLLLPGDANNDLQVTGADLVAIQQHFGDVGPPLDGTLLGDANDDGLVSGADLISVLQNFGKALTAPIPEPAGAALLALAGAFVLFRGSGRSRSPR